MTLQEIGIEPCYPRQATHITRAELKGGCILYILAASRFQAEYNKRILILKGLTK